MAFTDDKRINLGSTPNDGNGETLRSAGTKINDNFGELYGLIGAGGDVTFVNSITSGTGISVSSETGDIIVTNTAPNVNAFTGISILGQTSVLAAGNQALTLVGGGIVALTTNASTNTITISATQLQSDWDAVSGPTAIANKPSIPATQIQSDWNQASNVALDYIKNKPTVPVDLDQLTDHTNLLGRADYITISQSLDPIDPSGTGVVYTSSTGSLESGIKATIIVAGPNGAGLTHSQLSEILVARSFPDSGQGFPVVMLHVLGSAYTGGSALASFSAVWNDVDNRIDISATNLSAVVGTPIQVKVIATELVG